MDDSKPKNKGGGSKPQIGDEAMCVFLNALRGGARHSEAAREAGFCRSSFYRLKKRDPAFAAGWAEAVSHSSGLRYICPGEGRQLQLRRIRSVRFTPERQEAFLDHFAGTCNLADSAAAAGVSEATIFAHRAKDPDFAARFQTALEQGYARLEAMVVQRRIEGQKLLRPIEPTGEPEPEFERALKLLQRWERKDGRLGPRENGPGRQRRMSFDEAIALLERKLRHMEVPIPLPAPEDEPPPPPPADER